MTMAAIQSRLPGRFTLLLILLPTALLIAPLLGDFSAGRVLFNITLMLLLLSSVHATGLKRRERLIAWGVISVSVGVRLTGHVVDHAGVRIIGDLLTALSLGLVTGVLFLYVVRAVHVDTNVLSAALCVYLLLGLTFALLYAALEVVAPGSFAMPDDPASAVPSRFVGRTPDYVYYSLITMTTTGFGDIRPVSQIARSLTVIEVLAGQIYLAVMIARLVSLWRVGLSSEK